MRYSLEEQKALRTILASKNSMELVGDLLDSYAGLDCANVSFLLRKIPDIASFETERLGRRANLLRTFIGHTGNLFATDKLPDNVCKLIDYNVYDMFIYITAVANFKELYERAEQDPGRFYMPKASEFARANPIAEKYLRSFRDFLDRLDDTGCNFMELTGPGVPDSIDNAYTVAMWCKANLPIWYDLDEGKPKKGLKVRVKRTKVGKVKKDKYNEFHQKHGRK